MTTTRRIEAINFERFHIRISDTFGDRTGGDHIAVKPGWYYVWLLTVALQSFDFIIRVIGWIT